MVDTDLGLASRDRALKNEGYFKRIRGLGLSEDGCKDLGFRSREQGFFENLRASRSGRARGFGFGFRVLGFRV